MKLKYKHIEAARELRLWLGQVIVPATIAGAVIMTNPETRTMVSEKSKKVKDSIKNRFKKKG